MILDVYNFFEKDKTTPGLLVMDGDQFYGLISRVHFFEMMSKQYMYDIFSKRRVDFFVDFFVQNRKENSKDLFISSSTSVISAANEALKRDISDRLEPIIVNYSNNEIRLLDFYMLLLAQNEIQLIMNELVNQANEFKKEVLAIVTHDLRNPIGAIIGFSELIMNDNAIEDPRECALYIKKAAAQMEDLVNSFLASAVNDSIEFQLTYSTFDLNELALSIIKNYYSSAEKKRQKIVFANPNNSININSDNLKIKEVIENLLSNAIKYSEEGKEIRISLFKDEKDVEIQVQDQGPGLTESDTGENFWKIPEIKRPPYWQ